MCKRVWIHKKPHPSDKDSTDYVYPNGVEMFTFFWLFLLGGCDRGWEKYNENCYRFNTHSMDWFSAQVNVWCQWCSMGMTTVGLNEGRELFIPS